MKKILFAGSEAMPFAATGGLGDVLGALPPALAAAKPDWDVRVVMPLYAQVSDEWRSKMTFEKSIIVTLSWREQYCGIFSLDYKGVKYYFIDNEYYFKRNALYGFLDDNERFAFFSRAVLDLMDAVPVEYFHDFGHMEYTTGAPYLTELLDDFFVCITCNDTGRIAGNHTQQEESNCQNQEDNQYALQKSFDNSTKHM